MSDEKGTFCPLINSECQREKCQSWGSGSAESYECGSPLINGIFSIKEPINAYIKTEE